VIEILDDTSLREIKMLPQTAQFSAAAYLAGGAGFVTAAAGQLRLWDPLANQVVRDFVGRSENITAIAPMPDGRRIVTGGSDGTVRLWDMNTGEDLLTLPGAKSEIEALLISADGSSIFAGSDDGRVTTWRIPH
jgi:WD40 repeat protein